MVKPRREAGKAGQGERPSSPGEIWTDPKGSGGCWQAEGTSGAALLLGRRSCGARLVLGQAW